MSGCFGTRPAQPLLFAHRETEHTSEHRLERGQADLAVTLSGMRVSHREQRAARVHWNVQRGPGHQFLVVQVAGVDPRRRTADTAQRFRRRYTHTSEERAQRDLDTRCEASDHALLVEWDDLAVFVRKLFR